MHSLWGRQSTQAAWPKSAVQSSVTAHLQEFKNQTLPRPRASPVQPAPPPPAPAPAAIPLPTFLVPAPPAAQAPAVHASRPSKKFQLLFNQMKGERPEEMALFCLDLTSWCGRSGVEDEKIWQSCPDLQSSPSLLPPSLFMPLDLLLAHHANPLMFMFTSQPLKGPRQCRGHIAS